jgi:uncharacterized protein (TIGR03435 family)
MGSFVWESWAASLLRHLWQSTVFTTGVWLLTLALRRNAARLRYRLWMTASLKFLLPFSLLIAAGARLSSPGHFDRAQPKIATVVEGVAQPLLEAWPADATTRVYVAGTGTGWTTAHASTDWLPLLLLSAWAAGTLLLLARWMRSWQRLRAAVRRGNPVTLADGSQALMVAESVEPGIFGIMRPVLVLPRGIAEQLSAEQLDAIMAHELSHMRRRDNLTAALHMLVEAVFWFHPLVWWLGARLVDERERACDEAVLESRRQPVAYAEGILNVCKFYVEVPLSCVSGVMGSELKRRIARILSWQAARKLDLRRKALLGLAGVLALGAPLALGVVRGTTGAVKATAQAPPPKGNITGTWQGAAHAPGGHDRRFVLKIAKDEKGALSATLYSIDQKETPMAGDAVRFEGGTLRFVNQFPGLTYEGKISADGNSISGTVTQFGSFPLVIERATPGTEWATPAPPPRIVSMATDAKPGVEVATVKPTQPGTRLFMLVMQGEFLVIKNFSLKSLIKFAYDVPERQIAGDPGWMDTAKWDIEAKPDTPGMPSIAQMRMIVQKLLAERFALAYHEEKRKMPGYALTVGKNGPKMTKNADALESANFSGSPRGVLGARGATMGDFAHSLQGNILGQPVVDNTGLNGRWDLTLKWTPDETQFEGMGGKVPQPAEDANAPSLFTAIQEQLGLKLEAQKVDASVILVDHVEHPSPN